jgi:hypothetical protein
VKAFLRGVIYGASLFIAFATAWILFVAIHFILAIVAPHFPRTAIVMLPLCYLIPLLIISATSYLILRDLLHSKR